MKKAISVVHLEDVLYGWWSSSLNKIKSQLCEIFFLLFIFTPVCVTTEKHILWSITDRYTTLISSYSYPAFVLFNTLPFRSYQPPSSWKFSLNKTMCLILFNVTRLLVHILKCHEIFHYYNSSLCISISTNPLHKPLKILIERWETPFLCSNKVLRKSSGFIQIVTGTVSRIVENKVNWLLNLDQPKNTSWINLGFRNLEILYNQNHCQR